MTGAFSVIDGGLLRAETERRQVARRIAAEWLVIQLCGYRAAGFIWASSRVSWDGRVMWLERPDNPASGWEHAQFTGDVATDDVDNLSVALRREFGSDGLRMRDRLVLRWKCTIATLIEHRSIGSWEAVPEASRPLLWLWHRERGASKRSRGSR